jgi:hypothetical protein
MHPAIENEMLAIHRQVVTIGPDFRPTREINEFQER